MALGGLVLLGGLSRLVIDVTVEPVVDEISRLPGERPEIRLLRRMTELVEEAPAIVSTSALGQAVAIPAPRPVPDELLERLAIAVEESRRAWLNSGCGSISRRRGAAGDDERIGRIGGIAARDAGTSCVNSAGQHQSPGP